MKPPSIGEDNPQWVDEWLIRTLFNAAEVWERAQRGELRTRVVFDNHPSKPLAREPFCTRSQIIPYYLPNGAPVAQAHQ
ncbi:MAG: hypothetical protein HYY04_18300 [Chloroflexi bacterium]|nr:hypothetical protein [Chloroflexota bacterium]